MSTKTLTIPITDNHSRREFQAEIEQTAREYACMILRIVFRGNHATVTIRATRSLLPDLKEWVFGTIERKSGSRDGRRRMRMPRTVCA